MTDISFLASLAYDLGEDPVNYAANVVEAHLETHRAAFGCLPDPEDAAFARRILGDLLDAGWTPPALDPGPEAAS